MGSKSSRLHNSLENAFLKGVVLYQEEEEVEPSAISQRQAVREDMDYIPEFIVVDEEGDIKELWYGTWHKNEQLK